MRRRGWHACATPRCPEMRMPRAWCSHALVSELYGQGLVARPWGVSAHGVVISPPAMPHSAHHACLPPTAQRCPKMTAPRVEVINRRLGFLTAAPHCPAVRRRSTSRSPVGRSAVEWCHARKLCCCWEAMTQCARCPRLDPGLRHATIWPALSRRAAMPQYANIAGPNHKRFILFSTGNALVVRSRFTFCSLVARGAMGCCRA